MKMTEAELNAYRFTSGEEPSDEMLAQIMHEAAIEARYTHEIPEWAIEIYNKAKR